MALIDILDRLYQQHGELTPEVVLDAARPDDSPIHAYVFDREPGDAAEAYYLGRAHRLIQQCRVVMTGSGETEPRRVRAYFAVPSDQRGYTYEPQRVLVSVPSKAEAARMEAMRRLEQAGEAIEDLDLILSAAAPAPGPKRARRAVKTAMTALTT